MKIKRYFVTLTNPEASHSVKAYNLNEVERLLSSLDYLWGDIDFEEWTLEISPYWEEVPDDA